MDESFPKEGLPIPEKPLIEKHQVFDMYKISGNEDPRFREVLIAYLAQREDLLHDDELQPIKEQGKRNERVRETIEWNIEKAEMLIKVDLLDEAQETIEDIIDGVKGGIFWKNERNNRSYRKEAYNNKVVLFKIL